MKTKFNNFHISWNGCNLDGKVEKECKNIQTAFMAFTKDEISTSTFPNNNDSDVEDDDL